jgi:hypothetical protein
MLVTRASTASKIGFGTPPASSNDHQHVAGVNALESSRVVVGRLAAVRDELVADVPLGIQRDAPGQAAFPMGIAHVAQRIASTCGVVGAVVATNASPGGCTSIHQSASLDIVCDFETSCDALKAL